MFTCPGSGGHHCYFDNKPFLSFYSDGYSHRLSVFIPLNLPASNICTAPFPGSGKGPVYINCRFLTGCMPSIAGLQGVFFEIPDNIR
jgi:hypothetical protein